MRHLLLDESPFPQLIQLLPEYDNYVQYLFLIASIELLCERATLSTDVEGVTLPGAGAPVVAVSVVVAVVELASAGFFSKAPVLFIR
jgi:hypothetical protein